MAVNILYIIKTTLKMSLPVYYQIWIVVNINFF